MTDLSSHGHLIVKLYELRRDPAMRAARAWYAAEFDPQRAQDVAALMGGTYEQSARFRMITSYWDMVAGLVNHGALDEKLFFATNTEHIMIFAKLQPFLAEMRELFREPGYLQELEQLVQRMPNGEALVERRRKLGARWSRMKREESSPSSS
jgi:hypothetical protein